MKPTFLTAALAALAITIATGATPSLQLSTPVLGYVFDPVSQSIRQVTGVPGAAAIEGAVSPALRNAWVDSNAKLAIAITKDGAVAVVNWRGGPAQTTVLATALNGLQAVSFSASGDAAVLSGEVAVEVWSALASQPVKVASYTADGGVTAAAVRNNGAAAVATGAGNIVLVTGETARTIATGTPAKALAFLPGGTDLLAAGAGAVTKLSGVDANPGQTTVATFDGDASAMAISADGARAAIAVGGDLLVVTLDNGTIRLTCECETKHLETMTGNLVVHVSGATVLDGDAAPPRVFELPEGGAR